MRRAAGDLVELLIGPRSGRTLLKKKATTVNLVVIEAGYSGLLSLFDRFRIFKNITEQVIASMQRLEVMYCEVCGLPPEYCEFGPDFVKCKPWLLENCPDLYPDLAKEAEEKLGRLSLSAAEGGGGSGEADGGTKEDPAGTSARQKEPEPEQVQRLPGGKVKKKERPSVVIEKIVRNKRKSVTVVKGLEMFGVKLSDAAKKFGKKFASGASVVKGPTDKEQIDVQGDIMYDLVDFITATWDSVPEECIYFIEDGKKVRAA
ncbi:hypothetical protein CBR_g17727 [Chara braunii]|uniref:Translation machinery-associated protein 22 n=1 Tax=Chara braunii TaxID=69332 RepID=A0A388KVD0_CHABU|nr:hypothetical protein CBR_g17727 [Chara braunii]|eukprot:GBG74016.1 hypothetical protein CBR_g17727 [Chara braunii]